MALKYHFLVQVMISFLLLVYCIAIGADVRGGGEGANAPVLKYVIIIKKKYEKYCIYKILLFRLNSLILSRGLPTSGILSIHWIALSANVFNISLYVRSLKSFAMHYENLKKTCIFYLLGMSNQSPRKKIKTTHLKIRTTKTRVHKQ